MTQQSLLVTPNGIFLFCFLPLAVLFCSVGSGLPSSSKGTQSHSRLMKFHLPTWQGSQSMLLRPLAALTGHFDSWPINSAAPCFRSEQFHSTLMTVHLNTTLTSKTSLSFYLPDQSSILRFWWCNELDKNLSSSSTSHALLSLSAPDAWLCLGMRWADKSAQETQWRAARAPQGIHPEPETESRELSVPSSSSCSRGVRGGWESSFKSPQEQPLQGRPGSQLSLTLPPYSRLLETDLMGPVISSTPLLLLFPQRHRQTSARWGDEILSTGEQTQVSGSAAALRYL